MQLTKVRISYDLIFSFLVTVFCWYFSAKSKKERLLER